MRSLKTILIVDDESEIRRLLKRVLGRKDYQTVSASDGVDAMRLAREQAPDMVLLDLIMPRMGGIEVCELLRLNPSTRAIPIVMISALVETSQKIAGFNAGADEYITKPFDLQELQARIAGTFRRCERVSRVM